MRPMLDMDMIAKGLGAQRRGKLPVSGGYVGALQARAEVKGRHQVPSSGGRATDPKWTERRPIPLAPETLERLEELVKKIRETEHVMVEPMQLAALLLEKNVARISEEEAESVVRRRVMTAAER